MSGAYRWVVAIGTFAVMAAVPGGALAGKMFVPNYSTGNVSVVNTTTNKVITTITIPALSGDPRNVAVAPNGKTAYVVTYEANKLIPVSVASGAQGTAITLPGNTPEQIAISPNGKMAYVTEHSGLLVPVNLATGHVVGSGITITGFPYGVAITPNGKTAYVATSSGNTVVPVSTATNHAGAPIPVTSALWLAVTPNGKTVYAVDNSESEVIPISTATNHVGVTISLPSAQNLEDIAISLSGKKAYVDDFGGNGVYPINLSTKSVGSPFPLGAGDEGGYYMALRPDGKTLYASNQVQGTVTPVPTATQTAGTDIMLPVGSNPGQLGIVPNQGPRAAFTSSKHGLTLKLNGSGSSDPDGTVAEYIWSFGDGKTHTTTSPTISHSYSKSGTYTVRLTVADKSGCSTAQVFTGQTMYCNGSSAARTSHTVTVKKRHHHHH